MGGLTSGLAAVSHLRIATAPAAVGELIIVTGPPGAGKSAVCGPLAESFESSVLITGDWFFGLWRRGAIDPWLPEAVPQTAISAEAAAGAAGVFTRLSSCWVVYDGFIPPRGLSQFMAAAGLAAVHYAVLLPPLAVCVDRVASRPGHGFTSADATRSMYRDFTDVPPPTRHRITSAQGSPEDIAAEIHDQIAVGGLLWTTLGQ
jgi:adenylate kinase family enzyme